MTDKNTLRIIDGAGAEIPTAEVDEESCPVCFGAGWVSKSVPVGHPDFGEAFPCRCQKEADTDHRLDALSRYSNLGSLTRTTFEKTKREGLQTDSATSLMFQEALDAALEFADSPQGWIIFAGPSGSGKTHLAVSIANRCIERGLPVYFIVAADLLDHLRATYGPDSNVSYDELFGQVRNAPLLVLDDLSAQFTTPWAQEKMFQIISHRFNESLPTIITVRGPLDRLDEGLRTRMERHSGFSKVYRLGDLSSRQARSIGNIPEEMLRAMTFDSFDVNGRVGTDRIGRESLIRAHKAAIDFAINPQRWLLFTGQRGCGKTHLAISIAGAYMQQGHSVFRAFVPDLMDHLRGTFNPNSPVSYDDLFDQVKNVPLLILDDLGAEKSSPWAEEKLYQIVVHRHESRLPTVITSTSSLQRLRESKPDIASRLVDETAVNWQPITALNYKDSMQP